MTKEQFQAIKDQIYSICSQHGDVKICDGIVQVRIGPFEWFDFTEPKHFNKTEECHCTINIPASPCSAVSAEPGCYYCMYAKNHKGPHRACSFNKHNLHEWPNTSNSEPNNGDV